MVKVLVDREHITTKLPPTLVVQAASKLQKQFDDDPKRARKKCEHIVEWDGTRIALVCEYKQQENIAYITRARQLSGKKRMPWRM